MTCYLPLCRCHDDLRRGLRRHVSSSPYGPALDVLLPSSLPQRHVDVAAVSQSACLGRLRRVHVCHGIATVLVRRNDSRLSDPPRQGKESRGTSYLWLPGDGLARIRSALVAL